MRVSSVGAVLSMVITALSEETVEGFPRGSTTVAAFTCAVSVPLPLQLLKAIVAPVVVMLLTVTVQEGAPVIGVSVTPPPSVVRGLSLRAEAPEGESV